MGEMINAYKILVSKPKAKRPHGRPRSRCEDNIKMRLIKARWEGVNCIHMP